MCMTKLLGSVEIFSLAVCLLATLFHSHPVGQIGIFSSKGAQVHIGSTRSVKAGKETGVWYLKYYFCCLWLHSSFFISFFFFFLFKSETN